MSCIQVKMVGASGGWISTVSAIEVYSKYKQITCPMQIIR